MAQVAVAVQRRVDFLLDYLFDAWNELPSVEQEIADWDPLDQIEYVEEWGPKEALLDELRRHAFAGHLSRQQQARYSQLERLIAERRPALDRLRAS